MTYAFTGLVEAEDLADTFGDGHDEIHEALSPEMGWQALCYDWKGKRAWFVDRDASEPSWVVGGDTTLTPEADTDAMMAWYWTQGA